jgi:hypothetical protein
MFGEDVYTTEEMIAIMRMRQELITLYEDDDDDEIETVDGWIIA